MAKLWDVIPGNLGASVAHQDEVNDAVFSPDGTRIVTASEDGTATLWDGASGKQIVSFGHQDGVNRVAFSPDGTRVSTASADKTARIWNARSGDLIVSFFHEGEVDDVAFSKDGAEILASSADHTAKLWDASSGRLISSFSHQGRVYHAAFSPDGARIVTASWVTREWLRNALAYLPDHPLLHIALAGFETDSKRAKFLCVFGLARLPENSTVCRRAAELLLDQRRAALALSAVDKALHADPTDASAQHLRFRILDAMHR